MTDIAVRRPRPSSCAGLLAWRVRDAIAPAARVRTGAGRAADPLPVRRRRAVASPCSTPRCGSPAPRTPRSFPRTSHGCRCTSRLSAPLPRQCNEAHAAARGRRAARVARGRRRRRPHRARAARTATRCASSSRTSARTGSSSPPTPRAPTASTPPTSRGCSSTRRARSSCCDPRTTTSCAYRAMRRRRRSTGASRRAGACPNARARPRRPLVLTGHAHAAARSASR